MVPIGEKNTNRKSLIVIFLFLDMALLSPSMPSVLDFKINIFE